VISSQKLDDVQELQMALGDEVPDRNKQISSLRVVNLSRFVTGTVNLSSNNYSEFWNFWFIAISKIENFPV
jgi:hypothetical protein